MIDFQNWFEIMVGVLSLVGGWFLRTLWFDTKELTSKVQQIELLVAGQYIRKEEFERLAEALFAKLDKIEDKVDRKADK